MKDNRKYITGSGKMIIISSKNLKIDNNVKKKLHFAATTVPLHYKTMHHKHAVDIIMCMYMPAQQKLSKNLLAHKRME
ncbi:MAG: hypothetical protein KGJ07_08180 [Patescibacteria group bacterium]|nr:hypothetical protein [Patescibacteria group bacterium]